MSQPCIQEETIGKIKEFMENMKGLKATLFIISLSIVTQVITFSFLWGQSTASAKKDNEHLWKTVTPSTVENTRNIDKILGKLENVNIVGFAYAKGDKGERGLQGIQGAKGENGK